MNRNVTLVAALAALAALCALTGILGFTVLDSTLLGVVGVADSLILNAVARRLHVQS